MSTILDRIVASKRRELEQAQAAHPYRELEHRLNQAPPPRSFRAAIDGRAEVRIIAEVKKASPSAGVLRRDFDPVSIAQTYERHGAAAVSVLTDAPFFQGSLDHLSAVRQAVAVPLLRKDFVLDHYQLLESRVAGADAVLLIAEILDTSALTSLVREAQAMGMQALVEIHDAENLDRVLRCGANIVGVNNRNLRTFETRLEHTLEVARRVPRDVCLVSESGIKSHVDLERLMTVGVRAVLVGESLMRAADIGRALDELRGVRGSVISQ
jgi:indole-3-glycerol phosphate synthase